MGINEAKHLAEQKGLDANLHFFDGQHHHASTGDAKQLDLIASVTKIYTAALFLILENQQQLKLSSPAKEFLPKEMALLQAEDVTILDLLAHTSGIHDYYQHLALSKKTSAAEIENHPGWDFDEIIKLASSGSRTKLARDRAEYSFTNYALLNKILERFGGFGPLLQSQILTPLDLSETHLLASDNRELFASSSPLSFGKIPYQGFNRMASLGAEGAITASQRDVTRFLHALLTDKLLANTHALLTQRTTRLRLGIRYGVGVMLLPKFVSGRTNAIGHFGATGSAAFIDTNSNDVATVATNQFRQPRLAAKLLKQTF